MQPLETKLDELLVKKAPFQIPNDARQTIVKAMPWITLIGAILMLIAAWSLYQAVSLANSALSVAVGISSYYNLANVGPAIAWTPLVWVGLALLVAEAVVFFIAYPGLKERKKSAWNLLFYVSLLNAAQGIVQFIGYTNISTLIMSLLGSLVGLYILFQIRGLYTGAPAPAAGGSTPAPTPKDPAAKQ